MCSLGASKQGDANPDISIGFMTRNLWRHFRNIGGDPNGGHRNPREPTHSTVVDFRLNQQKSHYSLQKERDKEY